MIRVQHYQYSRHKDSIKRIYEMSFPLSERFDFSILEYCNNELNVHLSCILHDEYPVGMQFTVELPGDITYLMYFAIDKNFRNQNIGSEALKNLVISNNNVLLCIEKPVDSITKKRKEFYLRNGFFETNTFFEDTNVQYEVLTSCKDYKPTEKDLLNRYKCMTKNKIIWHKIKKSFNTDNIEFIN